MAENKKYKGINLPTELITEIEEIINNKKYGYSSKAEFVKEAIRIHMKTFKTEP